MPTTLKQLCMSVMLQPIGAELLKRFFFVFAISLRAVVVLNSFCIVCSRRNFTVKKVVSVVYRM